MDLNVVRDFHSGMDVVCDSTVAWMDQSNIRSTATIHKRYHCWKEDVEHLSGSNGSTATLLEKKGKKSMRLAAHCP